MSSPHPILACNKVYFYSHGDRNTFFTWLGNIPCIDYVDIVDTTLRLHLMTTDIHDHDLLALLYRYDKTSMPQLQQFASEQNTHWFTKNSNAYWYHHVFC